MWICGYEKDDHIRPYKEDIRGSVNVNEGYIYVCEGNESINIWGMNEYMKDEKESESINMWIWEWSWEGVWGRVRDEWDHIRGMNDV